jgi:hypothetical protein
MRLDGDFIVLDDCIGRNWMPRVQVALLDLVCRLIGHNIWRTGAVRQIDGGSLPLKASYCRRCFKGGYVRGDYAHTRTA